MRAQPDTLGAALAGAHALLRGETASPQLDAEVLLAHVLKQPREYILAHREAAVSAPQQRSFTSLIRRRAEGVPLPYLTGHIEFYGREFIITPTVMVPRPESEAVVAEAIRLFWETSPLHPTPDTLHPIVSDIGTGSGILAVSIAAEVPRARVVATDKSAAALVVARRNARKHKVAKRMTFIESDLLTEIPPELAPTMIVANLPYVPTDELKNAGGRLETRGLLWEPRKALDGGPDGLFLYRRFFRQLAAHMPRPQGLRGGNPWGRSLTRPQGPRVGDPWGRPLRNLVLEHSPAHRRPLLELAHDALPEFRPHDVTPFVTSWSSD